MTHKFKSSNSRKKKSGGHHRGRPADSGAQTSLETGVLALLASEQEPLAAAAIMQMLALPRSARKELKESLDHLERRGQVEKKDKQYALSGESGLLRGILALTSRGFGFVRLDEAKPGEKEVFIAQRDLGGASHDDTVLVSITGQSRGRKEGRVIRVISRAHSRLCGIYTASGRSGYITPDNDKLPYTVLIRQGHCLGARNGVAVLAEITDFGSEGRGPEGRIIEVLGDPLHPGVQIRMAMEQFSLSGEYPQEALEEASKLDELRECLPPRLDLRETLHVTIDGASARDFDDAICAERTAAGFRLHVSIADVSHYVRTGSPLDREAYRRGTSVYLPDRVLPMLPERLSNDLCSLVPDRDRPVFTAILDFDRQGRRTASRFAKSMIRSHQRFTYDTVNALVYMHDKQLRSEYQDLLPMLDTAAELAGLLHVRRMERGSLGFTIPEAEIRLRGETITSVTRAARNQAHQLIEECMLAANEAVAETLDQRGQSVLYRVHEKPDPEKVARFVETAETLGLLLPPMQLTPAWFARVLEAATGAPAEYVVNNLLLRTMQQARYAPENLGHFGLAADFYLHFTSPIRRYPDLVAHRALQALLGKEGKRGRILPGDTELAEAGMELSRRERVAVDTERNVQARLAVLFMRERIGEVFSAIISGVTTFGIFVELLDYFISGAVPIGDMGDDYFIHDSRSHRMTGERGGQRFQIGDIIQVRLERTDIVSKRLTFSIAGQDGSPSFS